MVEIYELLEPGTLESRYVGQARSAKKRFAWHLQAARRSVPGRVYNWIRRVIRDGSVPTLLIIEQCQDDQANEAEMRWIECRREEGHDLTNCTDGGGGTRGRRHTEE